MTVIAKEKPATGWSDPAATAPPPQDGMGPQPDEKFLAPELTTLYIKEIDVKEAYVVPDKTPDVLIPALFASSRWEVASSVAECLQT